jgi:hypothetical protein
MAGGFLRPLLMVRVTARMGIAGGGPRESWASTGQNRVGAGLDATLPLDHQSGSDATTGERVVRERSSWLLTAIALAIAARAKGALSVSVEVKPTGIGFVWRRAGLNRQRSECQEDDEDGV